MSAEVNHWWSFLCIVAVVNIAAWSGAAAMLRRRRITLSAEAYASVCAQLVLSGVYVFGCAYRSFFPVFDVPRLCLFDSWLSSAMLGRTVATIAELAFVAQWAVLLRESAKATGSPVAGTVSRVIFPMMCVAEACSWYSVITTSNLGHVVEETIWGCFGLLLVATGMLIWPRCTDAWRRALVGWSAVGLTYAAFMFFVDVPMYFSRWSADEAHARHYLGLAQGVEDASQRRIVSYDWQNWRSEVPWMSLYFSVAVWLSISLIHASAPEGRTPGLRRQRAPAPVYGSQATIKGHFVRRSLTGG